MAWIMSWSRYLDWLSRMEVVSDEHMTGDRNRQTLAAFMVHCPTCQEPHTIEASNQRSRIFDPRTQQFQCSQCGAVALVEVVIDECDPDPPGS